MKKLPRVHPDIIDSLAHDLHDMTPYQLWKKEMIKLDKKNPVIAEFIRNWTKDIKGAGFVCATSCAILVYKLLETQVEVNNLNQELKL